jgi:hypothetical protein
LKLVILAGGDFAIRHTVTIRRNARGFGSTIRHIWGRRDGQCDV